MLRDLLSGIATLLLLRRSSLLGFLLLLLLCLTSISRRGNIGRLLAVSLGAARHRSLALLLAAPGNLQDDLVRGLVDSDGGLQEVALDGAETAGGTATRSALAEEVGGGRVTGYATEDDTS